MSLQAAIAVVERLVKEGVIPRYAVAGAVGAAFYLEPASTFDLDILVSVDAFRSRPGSPLITLDPIRDALAKAGYGEFRDEGIVIEVCNQGQSGNSVARRTSGPNVSTWKLMADFTLAIASS